jgi:RNA polymerase sigma-70 factor (ECF subfamily)
LHERTGERDFDDWARQAQRGDELALGRLLRAARPHVLRWALVYTGSADDAEDITQAALMRAQRALPDFGFQARFTTWLYSVTRSVAADWRRKQRRREDLFARRAVAEETSWDSPQLDEQQLIGLVRKYFEVLPARQREVFDLVDLQGHAAADAATLMGANAATVRVHLLRARRTIRERILQHHAALVEDRWR